MKIRIDYVSNSSSSSFLVLGSKYTPNDGRRLTIEDFDNLEDGEVFFAVFPNICDGDYVFKLTPDLMMDFDMRQRPIVLDEKDDCVEIYKIRKFRSDEYDDTGTVYCAETWGTHCAPAEKADIDVMPRKEGESVMCWMVDDHTPRTHKAILDWLGRRGGEEGQ